MDLDLITLYDVSRYPWSYDDDNIKIFNSNEAQALSYLALQLYHTTLAKVLWPLNHGQKHFAFNFDSFSELIFKWTLIWQELTMVTTRSMSISGTK